MFCFFFEGKCYKIMSFFFAKFIFNVLFRLFACISLINEF